MRYSQIPYAGAFRAALSYSPDTEKAALSSAPDATQIEWWRARPNPLWRPDSGSSEGPYVSEFIREKQAPPPDGFWAIVRGMRADRRYTNSGEMEVGSVSLTFDPDATPMGNQDWVRILGNGTSGTVPDVRTYLQKQTLIRGRSTVDGSGTISTSGSAVIGIDTAFTSFFQPGDVLGVGDGQFLVASIASDTTLTLSTTTDADYQTFAYTKGVDRVLYPPALGVVDARDGSTIYTPGSDVKIAPDQESIQWQSASKCPAPGMGYGLIYTYVPTYVIADPGTIRPIVIGKRTMSSILARLWKPQQLTI